jgi:hypothetical protein
MLKQDGCSECGRLWSEYEDATRSGFILESKLQIASLARDSEGVLRLQPEMHSALERRRALRKQILAHGSESHGQADGQADAAEA